ncbi:hypothetical protein EK904_013974 [Melospiza melodia maxima]|nr:hypothetical protein EK904_013974 [Melospiza melodia maxima]
MGGKNAVRVISLFLDNASLKLYLYFAWNFRGHSSCYNIRDNLRPLVYSPWRCKTLTPIAGSCPSSPPCHQHHARGHIQPLTGQGYYDVCAEAPCEQQCTDNFGRVLCTCYPGYRYDRERHRNREKPYCLDIDECATSNGTLCSQICVNTVGSYRCECHEGYVREEDGRTCTKGDKGRLLCCQIMLLILASKSLVKKCLPLMHISLAPQASLANQALQGLQDLKGVKELLDYLDLLASQALVDRWGQWAHLQIYHTLSRADGALWAHLAPQGEMGPPGSFDFLLLMMADIRNDIAELQERVFGHRTHSSTEEFPLPQEFTNYHDTVDFGSGEDYKPRATSRNTRIQKADHP